MPEAGVVVLVRKGVKLREERQGYGDAVQRQHEYILSIRLSEQRGNPRSRPSFDEVYARRERAFARIMLVAEELHSPIDQGPADPSSHRWEEHRRLVGEIEGYDDQVYDLTLELALLVDEAGQRHGPPLDRLVNDDAARGSWRSMVNVLEKVLAGQPEASAREEKQTPSFPSDLPKEGA